MKIPGHVHFEEVNLRFYVTHGKGAKSKRGVVFIRELVPKPAIAFVANKLCGENYRSLPMKHRWGTRGERQHVEYAWKTGNGWNTVSLVADTKSRKIEDSSEEAFITQHYWGYTKVDQHSSFEYEVTHPKWKHYPVMEWDIDVNFADTYGRELDWLQTLSPHSVMLAEGSAITVENKRKIRLDGEG